MVISVEVGVGVGSGVEAGSGVGVGVGVAAHAARAAEKPPTTGRGGGVGASSERPEATAVEGQSAVVAAPPRAVQQRRSVRRVAAASLETMTPREREAVRVRSPPASSEDEEEDDGSGGEDRVQLWHRSERRKTAGAFHGPPAADVDRRRRCVLRAGGAFGAFCLRLSLVCAQATPGPSAAIWLATCGSTRSMRCTTARTGARLRPGRDEAR